MSATVPYRLLVENISDLLAEVTLDGRFLYVTPSFETALGYKPEELIGTEVFAHVHPDDQESARAKYALPEASAAIRFRHRNGQWRWLEVKGRDFSTPTGEVRRVIIARDVTKQREAEEALRRSEQHLRAIFDNALVVVVATTNDGAITEWNSQAEHIFGWRRDETIGRRIVELLLPERFRQRYEAEFRRYIDSDEPRKFNQPCEITALRRDQHEITVEVSALRLVTNNGTSFCFFVRDLTSLKEAQAAHARLEAQLCQSQKLEAIGRIAGGVAHDFNNILTVISANNELAQLLVGRSHQAMEHLEEVQHSCQRAAELVRQILTFSRPQNSQRQMIDLTVVVQEATKMLRPTLPASIEIKTSFDGNCGRVTADQSQMLQVILNLATNAVHAMRQNPGLLEFIVQPARVDETTAINQPGLVSGDYVKLTVRDTGHGMSPATLEKVFDPFFTTKPPGEGTGLGLSVVHGILKSHCGGIYAESEPGRGAMFHVFLPATKTDQTLNMKEPTIPRGNGQKILLVDDDVAVADSCGRILNRLGYETAIQNDSASAMKLLRAAPRGFDCIITDHCMSNMNGVELIAESRGLGINTPIILMTGNATQFTPDSLQNQGISAILSKPFTPLKLAETIRHALASVQPNAS